MIEGAEYQEALKSKNHTNAALHRSNPGLDGLHMHEIHLVKFGGRRIKQCCEIPEEIMP
jgi:hypothetical protein